MENQIRSFRKKREVVKRNFWVDLPDDVLGLILSKLHFTDQIRFRAVCRSWRVSEDELTRCSDNLPWIATRRWVHSENLIKIPIKGELFDPYLKKRHTVLNSRSNSMEKFLRTSRFTSAEVYATKQGWMLIGCPSRSPSSLIMHNTFNDQFVVLPPLNYSYDCVATFNNPWSQDCEIFVLFRDFRKDDALYIGSYVRYRDEEWSLNRLLGGIEDKYCYCMQYVGGKLYCLFEQGKLVKYNVADKSWELLTEGLRGQMSHCWLIENEGGFLMVSNKNDHYHKWYVFSFDWYRMSWILNTNLNSTAFFISGNVVLSSPLTDSDGEKIADCRVFFIRDEDAFCNNKDYDIDEDESVMCYSLKERRLIQSEEFGWVKRSIWKTSFIEPPYIRN